MKVIKRDGSKAEFDWNKIYNAISKAWKEVYETDEPVKELWPKFQETWDCCHSEEDLHVETIQDSVEDFLMGCDSKVAKAYIIYRYNHRLTRELKDNKKYADTIMELVNGKQNDTSKENANKDASQLYVIRDLIAGETSKKLYKELCLPTHIRQLHEDGAIHVHDMDYRIQQYITNCELTNLEDCLQNGTVINGKLIHKPHSLRTACTIASQIITAVSSSTYGGQTISLTHLAPFIRESSKQLELKLNGNTSLVKKFLEEEVKNSIQTLLYQLNTMATTNGQSPFITLFLYPKENKEYYSETLWLCEEVLRQRIAGMESPKGQTINPTFPKLVVCLTEDMFQDGEMHEFAKLCAECVTKRMVPDFISEKNIKVIKEGCVIPPMGKLCYSPCKISLTLLRGVHKKENLFILIVY